MYKYIDKKVQMNNKINVKNQNKNKLNIQSKFQQTPINQYSMHSNEIMKLHQIIGNQKVAQLYQQDRNSNNNFSIKQNKDEVCQFKWVRFNERNYQIWDKIIDGYVWFRKMTEKGFQYSKVKKENMNSKLLAFVKEETYGEDFPNELKPNPPTGVVFGTQNRTKEEVVEAIFAGYRIFDTAESYQNIEDVMAGLKLGLKLAKLKRKKIKIIYKFNIRENPEDSINYITSLVSFFGTYFDTVMIHNLPDNIDLINKTIFGLRDLKEKKFVKSIGVSNLEISKVKDIKLKEGDLVENSIIQKDYEKVIRTFCKERGLIYLGFKFFDLTKDEEIKKIALKYKISTISLLIAWARAERIMPILSSGNKVRRIENADVWYEKVPDNAIKDICIYMSEKKKIKKEKKSLFRLPELPEKCKRFIEELHKNVFSNNDQWNIYKSKLFRNPKSFMRLHKELRPYGNNKIPEVKETYEKYYGKLTINIIGEISKINYCDAGKFYFAIIAGLRNN